jgi:acetyltransferase-like isoleucine patch superfamily enzyme
VLAVLPGIPGVFLRRAFYRLTLASCSLSLTVGFGAFFAHRDSHVEEDVYVGPFAVIGLVRLKTGTLIGTRASLLSGGMQHEWDENGRLTPTSPDNLRQIEIGPHTWIGEAATVMASVGKGSLVSAGAVVSAPVPDGVVVAGNPARFVRKLRPDIPVAEVVDFKERGHEPFVHARH